MNVYASNSGQMGFLTSALETLQGLEGSFMVVGGDFNAVYSASKDRLTLFNPNISNGAHAFPSFRRLLRSHRLLDTWRIKHATSRPYTSYSPAHKMYPRLDYFLISTPLLFKVVSSEMGPITWSDHSPVFLNLAMLTASSKACHWRLNEFLLSHESSKVQLSHP